MNEKIKQALWYQGASLGAIGLIAALVLAAANNATEAAIVRARADDLKLSLAQVLPEGFADNDLLRDSIKLAGSDGAPIEVHRARRKGRVEALIFEARGKGYAGPVVLVMAVDRDGRVLGVRVIQHNETPGLGDKVDAAKTDWIHSFEGKSLAQPAEARWAVRKDGGDFDQFAGATITPRAVVGAVKGGLQLFAARRAEMLGEPRVAATGAQ
jgi:electron transport complex protein RnfG